MDANNAPRWRQQRFVIGGPRALSIPKTTLALQARLLAVEDRSPTWRGEGAPYRRLLLFEMRDGLRVLWESGVPHLSEEHVAGFSDGRPTIEAQVYDLLEWFRRSTDPSSASWHDVRQRVLDLVIQPRGRVLAGKEVAMWFPELHASARARLLLRD